MEDYTQHTYHHVELIVTSLRPTQTPRYSSSSPWVEKVNLTVNCVTRTHHRHMGETIFTEAESQTNMIIISLTPKGDRDLDKSMNEDGTKPIRWPLPDSHCKNWMVANILGRMEHVLPNSLKHNVDADMICKVLIEQDHNIGDVNDWMMRRAFEESAPRMAPASESSIKSLRKMIIVDCEDDGVGGCESCTVCFEGFVEGSKVLCMPCSHVFHHDCIGKWLRTSHSCPNCRYEMPIN